MAVSLVIIVCIIAIVVYAALSKSKKRYKALEEKCIGGCKTANGELESLLEIKRFFSPEEESAYKGRFKALRGDVAALAGSSFFKASKPELSGVVSFARNYDNLYELRAKNNRHNSAFRTISGSRIFEDYRELTNGVAYFTESRKLMFVDRYKDVVEVLKEAFKDRELLDSILKANVTEVRTEKEYRDIVSDYDNIDEIKKKVNGEYVRRELDGNFRYFQSVLKYPLSEQQRNAIVQDEDNVLVISSAGSGKTFTIEGKVRYLVEKRNVSPSNILVVTFTRKAAESLKERINLDGVTCSTFDSLANSVVSRSKGDHPNICDEKNVSERIFAKLNKDSGFVNAVTKYLLMYSTTPQSEIEAESAEELVSARKSSERRTTLPCMDGNVVFPKSEQERIIGDILAKNGISYRYEENYEYHVSTPEYMQYRPDFTIHYYADETRTEIGADGIAREVSVRVEKRLYLEHFGIGLDKKVPKWFANHGESYDSANSRYNSGIEWKKSLHREKGTDLIYTTSGDFTLHGTDGVETIILNMLREKGVPINPLSPEELSRMIFESNPQRFRSVKTMVTSFVSLLKGGGKKLEEVKSSIRSSCSNYETANPVNRFLKGIVGPQRRTILQERMNYFQQQRDLFVIENIIEPYYREYSKWLEDNGQKDFTDVIHDASLFLQSGSKKRYDYILVDEFQDLSIIRYLFIQALRSEEPFKTKLFCVGDDWQSIYRFAGSDISLFTEFDRYFGFVEECRIEQTYRFGEPLLSISSDFILKNPNQKRKTVSCLESQHTRLECEPFVRRSYRNAYGSRVNDTDIHAIVRRKMSQYGGEGSLLFLGRYSFDADLLHNADRGFIVKKKGDRATVAIDGREYPFLTVHQAKGLEADNVILLNCNSGTYGFPSTVEDDPVLNHVLSEDDSFRFGEERRLFYVAITRAKKNICILYESEHPSSFLEGMVEENESPYGKCPLCRTGNRTVYQQKVVSNGNTLIVYRCSNERYGCPYEEKEWINRPDWYYGKGNNSYYG